MFLVRSHAASLRLSGFSVNGRFGDLISAKVVKVDAANDLALLKAEVRAAGKDEGRIMNDETGERQAEVLVLIY